MKRNFFRLAAMLATAVALAPQAEAGAAQGVNAPRDIFSFNDHLLIARALAGGAKRGSFIFAAIPGRASDLAGGVKAIGGLVDYEADELDYLRATIPIDKVGRLGHTDIEVANFEAPDQFGPTYQSARKAVGAPAKQGVLPPFVLPAGTGESNPYSGTKDVGQPAFLHDHPTYDGRGVRVGIEESPDLNSPFLRYAKDLQGNAVPKIADDFTTLGPNDPTRIGGSHNEVLGWVDMRTRVAAMNGRFHYRGHWFAAPADGVYQIGTYRYDYPILAGWLRNLAHPHGTSCEEAATFTVLWNKTSDVVWVNTDQNCSLADDKPMRTYRIHHDVGSLPLGFDWNIYGMAFPPGAKPLGRYPFVIQTDKDDSFVWLGFFDASGHADGVATSIAGARLFDHYDGMAPNAQLVVAFGSYDSYAKSLEGIIALARSPVDIISLQAGSQFASDPGHNVYNIILDRLVEKYGVLITVSASNDGPTITNVETPADSNDVLAIGGYASRERERVTEGAWLSHDDNVVGYSSRGPRLDGGFKPDLLAPTETLVGAPTIMPPQTIAGTYRLPTGYQVFGGTSQASPMAAGALALLISAAKQAGVPHDPARVRQAVLSTARYLPAYAPVDQGAGLIDIPAAWNALKALATEAPIAETSERRGIYEREGWHAGDSGHRRLDFAFSSAGTIPSTLSIRWKSDDGTFTSASEIEVSAGRSAVLDVAISPHTSGLHSAVAEVIDPFNGLVLDERMCTVVASEPLDAADRFRIAHRFAVEHPGYKRFFIDVPQGMGTFVVRVTAASGGFASVSNTVTSLYLLNVRTPSDDTPDEDIVHPWVQKGRVWQHAYANPEPGVWEVTIDVNNPSSLYSDPRQHAVLPSSQFILSAAAYAVRFAQPVDVSRPLSSVQMLNEMNGFHPLTGFAPLGSRFETSMTLSPEHSRRTFVIDVPKGTSEVRAQITPVSSAGSSIAVFLFSCAADTGLRKALGASYGVYYQGDCEFRSSGDGRDDGIASTAFPSSSLTFDTEIPAGRWIAVVEAYPLPRRSAVVNYADYVFNRSYGTSTLIPTQSYYSAGARWTQRVKIARGAAVPHGRTLVAFPSMPATETDTMWGIYTFLDQSWDSLARQKPRIRDEYESTVSEGSP